MVMVPSLFGAPVLYLDLAVFSFQVPANGSAAMSVAENAKRAIPSFAYRMLFSLCWGLYRRGGRVARGGRSFGLPGGCIAVDANGRAGVGHEFGAAALDQ